MGILIACEENKAKLPYRFKVTDTGIYTAEELFYYVYHNFLLLTDELYEEAFLMWLEKELFLPEKAEKIREMKKNYSGYDAQVEAASILLLDNSYYQEEEVQEFLLRQNERKNVSPGELAVKKAESFLQHGRYFEAGMIYESLLAGDGMYAVLKEEAGRIRHNLGVCRLHTEGFKRAAKDFKAAYEMTGGEESKRQYVLCMLLGGNESTFGAEESISEAYVKGIREEIQDSLLQYGSSDEYKKLEELKEARDSGKPADFLQGVRERLESYKQEYRSENS
ncbi:hypothetical protein [Anaerocolumna jejuensis]|uniref:hypothetical protein n=1 Tax=Anaerocolumna jejuensis TaxID=259063 RepID=UPI003F7B5F29